MKPSALAIKSNHATSSGLAPPPYHLNLKYEEIMECSMKKSVYLIKCHHKVMIDTSNPRVLSSRIVMSSILIQRLKTT
jgi:hypothetical protein